MRHCWRSAARRGKRRGRCSSAASRLSASSLAPSWRSAQDGTSPACRSRSTSPRSRPGRQRRRASTSSTPLPHGPARPGCSLSQGSRALRPGGHLAFWGAQHAFPPASTLRHRDPGGQRRHRREPPGKSGRLLPPRTSRTRRPTRVERPLHQHQVRRYLWERYYTADEYITLLDTFSGHIAMDESKRERPDPSGPGTHQPPLRSTSPAALVLNPPRRRPRALTLTGPQAPFAARLLRARDEA